MTDLGELRNFLGMKIERKQESKLITITQENFIDKILIKFDFDKEYSQDTPMKTRQVTNTELRKREFKRKTILKKKQ